MEKIGGWLVVFFGQGGGCKMVRVVGVLGAGSLGCSMAETWLRVVIRWIWQRNGSGWLVCRQGMGGEMVMDDGSAEDEMSRLVCSFSLDGGCKMVVDGFGEGMGVGGW